MLGFFSSRSSSLYLTSYNLLKLGEIRPLLYYLLDLVYDTGRFQRFYRENPDRRLRIEDVQGWQMYLSLSDLGVSHELLKNGVREPQATKIYRRELRSLADSVDSPTIVDLGANIGYYALMAAHTLDRNCMVYAIEPQPEDADLLRKSVEINGFQDCVEVWNGALSDESGTTELTTTRRSNLNRIVREDAAEMDADETIEVTVVTGDEFLRERGISSDEVDVLRLDVNGYEPNVVQGMEDLLYQDGALLLFMSIHGTTKDNEGYEDMMNVLARSGFEIVSATQDERTLDVSDFDEIDDLDGSVELFCRK